MKRQKTKRWRYDLRLEERKRSVGIFKVNKKKIEDFRSCDVVLVKGTEKKKKKKSTK